MHLISDDIMQALCWTFIHSLWQGLLLAVAGGAVILFTKKSSSTFRYNFLTGLFFAFVLTACFTFLLECQGNATDGTYDMQSSGNRQHIVFTTQIMPHAVVISRKNLDTFISYFNEHASLLVTAWFIIFSAQFIKLLANAGYVHRIRHYKTYEPTRFWKRRVKELAEELGIKQKVRLLQSGLVRVPLMVGIIKPVILFPISLMMQLPAGQVEAVLLHELAHIKRRDYFVNLLQHFAEIIFFFNPGVHWISSLIRDERENCCDDIAIGQTNSKKEFIHALVSFQEYNMANSNHVMALAGRKGHLLNRIRRILTSNNKTLNNMEKIFLGAGVVIVGLATIAFTRTMEKQNPQAKEAVQAQMAKNEISDTIPEKKYADTSADFGVQDLTHFSMSTILAGKEYRMVIEGNDVKELYVDGKKIPTEKLSEYKEIIQRIYKQAALRQAQEQMKLQQLIMERDKDYANLELLKRRQDDSQELLKSQQDETIIKENEEAMSILMKQQEDLAKRMVLLKKQREDILEQSQQSGAEEQAGLNAHRAELMAQLADIQRQTNEVAAKLASEKNGSGDEELYSKNRRDLLAFKMDLLAEQKALIQHLTDLRIINDSDSPDRPIPPVVTNDNPVPPVPPVFSPLSYIIDDLIAGKVIRSGDNLSFTLNNEILKVNGVLQTGDLHEKLRKKYLKTKKSQIIFSKHGQTISTEIENN